MAATAYETSSFTNRQVAKLQQRGLGLAISEEGLIARGGTVVGHCDPETLLFPDLKVLLENLDVLGLDFRQGQQATSEADLRQIAAFPEEVVITPHREGAAVGVKLDGEFRFASFSDIDAARDVARLYEDYQQLARDVALRRGIELQPALTSLEDAPSQPLQPPTLSEHEQGFDHA